MANKLKLGISAKIAIVISAVVVIVLGILITGVIMTFRGAMNSSIHDEFTMTSKANAIYASNILKSAETLAVDMQLYINHYYKYKDEEKRNMLGQDYNSWQAPGIKNDKSMIYNVPISELELDVEKYMLFTIVDAIKANPDIAGAGVYFEPYKFSEFVDGYAVYITDDDTIETVAPEFYNFSEYGSEEYYTIAKDHQELVFTKTYEYEGIDIITASAPIIHKGEIMGVICVDIDVSTFSNMIKQNDRYPSMYTTLYNEEKTIIYDTEDLNDIGKNMQTFFAFPNEYNELSSLLEKGKPFSYESTRENGKKVSRFYTPIPLAEGNWWILSALATDDIDAIINNVVVFLMISAFALELLLVASILFATNRMLKPIGKILKAARSIERGDFDIELHPKTNDEIGMLEHTFNSMVKSLRSVIVDISRVLDSISGKNLDVKTSVEYQGEFGKIQSSINNIVSILNNVVTNINVSAKGVSQGSRMVATNAQSLAHGTTEQAGAVEELHATMTEITAQVTETAKNSSAAQEMAEEASTAISNSNQYMQQLMEAMNAMNKKSKQINKVIKTIQDIAFQTNILALNASVEAARAGDAGKGFSVVAGEVRNLAGKSSEASKNTAMLINDSVASIKEGVRLAEIAANELNAVVGNVNSTASVISEISQSCKEQAEAIALVSAGIEQISSVVQTNSATSEESAAASETLSSEAYMLERLIVEFKTKEQNLKLPQATPLLTLSDGGSYKNSDIINL